MTSAATALTAQAQERVAAAGQGDVAEVVVTGSRIRRVDAETASPVLVIDQAAIQASGITSAGELVQRIPSIAGAATNPQVNNGGGFGEANIELRGLDAKRTLILVDGHRLGLVGSSDATDVNQIPISLIERVEVLKEGAGAIYGSDAVGGVVNFITRKDLDGLEVNTDYGRTSRKDGEHYSVDATFGSSTDKMSFMLGGSFTHQDAVSAGDRDFSKYALYFYGGSVGVTQAGSSRTPNGRIALPAGNPYGCANVTRSEGASGASLADYRCYSTATDAFNFQPYNLLMTPQERVAIFSKVNYKINDYVEVYATGMNNRTHSGFEIAPLPFDATVDDTVISANNAYNPFGIDFGGISGVNPNFRLRMSSLGTRHSDTDSDSKVFNGGVRGKLGETGWEWDLNLTTSRLDQHANIGGYLLKPNLGPALGPSTPDPVTGEWRCGTDAAHIIPGCIPVNFFNPTSADQVTALNNISANYNTDNEYKYRAASLDFNGKLFTAPAGDVLASFGLSYDDRWGEFTADRTVQAQPPLYLQCQLANETCSGDTHGQYNSKQAYVELFVPLLKDLPGVHALNIDIGARYSDYDKFGNTTKGDLKLEYRPVQDLLVRGTYSQIFRVPTITDLYASPVNSSITFTDPCTGLTSAQVAANPNLSVACQGVPVDADYAYGLSQITGLLLANPDLKPETGDVKTFGVVYEPNFVRGLSLEVDYWKYHIEDVITTLDPNYSINQCVQTADPAFCNLVTRFGPGAASPGDILVFQAPTVNLGALDTVGIDYGVRYMLRDTGIGSFQFSIDATHTNAYDSHPGPGAQTQHIAGTFDRQFGHYAKWRAVAQVGWTYQDFQALVSARFTDGVVLHEPATNEDIVDPDTGDVTGQWPDLKIPSVTYIDLTVGYSIAPTNTKVQFGIRNVSDKQPPILYLNNVTNANTDVSTYDTLGRQWWLSLSQKF